MTRWRFAIPVLVLLASCVVSPQPSPPNLSPEKVSAAGQTGDIVDGVRLRGGPGAVDPPEGVVVGTNLDDAAREPWSEPVREDGSFDLIIPGTLTGEMRLQARNGSSRSVPFDFFYDFTAETLTPSTRALAGCLVVDPEHEVDFGDVRVGESAELRVRVTNDCGEDLTIAAPRIREASSPFTASGGATVVPDGGSIDVLVRAEPIEPGAFEGTVFVEATAPTRDRRPLTLFVRGTD